MSLTEVYLHGGPGMNDYMPRFFPKTDNTLFYQQKNPASSIEDLVNPLRQMLEPIDSFVLIAHSFGGVIALEYLKRAGARLPHAMVLMGVPVYYGCEQDFQDECKKRNLIQPTPADVFLSPKEKENPENIKTLAAIFEGFNPQTLSAIGSYLSKFDFRELLNKTTIPTLVLSGADDVRVPARAQKNYGGGNEKVQYATIAGAGHFSFIESENAKIIQEKIQNFLNPTAAVF